MLDRYFAANKFPRYIHIIKWKSNLISISLRRLKYLHIIWFLILRVTEFYKLHITKSIFSSYYLDTKLLYNACNIAHHFMKLHDKFYSQSSCANVCFNDFLCLSKHVWKGLTSIIGRKMRGPTSLVIGPKSTYTTNFNNKTSPHSTSPPARKSRGITLANKEKCFTKPNISRGNATFEYQVS